MRDQVWQKVIGNLPVDKMDTGGIVGPTRNREWDYDQKLQGVITNSIDMDRVVFDYPRGLFARVHDIAHHRMT
jgi:hypothetical protein